MWPGACTPDGYGVFRLNRAYVYAHRAAYELFVGPIGDSKMVRHSCDTPSCCQPHHLSVGSQVDNMSDAVTRERTSRGEARPSAKMTDDKVREIRRRYPSESCKSLGQEFGLNERNIRKIVRRQTWRHVS